MNSWTDCYVTHFWCSSDNLYSVYNTRYVCENHAYIACRLAQLISYRRVKCHRLLRYRKFCFASFFILTVDAPIYGKRSATIHAAMPLLDLLTLQCDVQLISLLSTPHHSLPQDRRQTLLLQRILHSSDVSSKLNQVCYFPIWSDRYLPKKTFCSNHPSPWWTMFISKGGRITNFVTVIGTHFFLKKSALLVYVFKPMLCKVIIVEPEFHRMCHAVFG